MDPTDILLVESDPERGPNVEALLVKEGLSVRVATSLAEAQLLVNEAHFYLLLANPLLVDGSALPFIRAWLETSRPVVALSDAYLGSTAAALLKKQLPLFDVLQVPVDADRLSSCLRACLGARYPDDGRKAASAQDPTADSRVWSRPPALDPASTPLMGTLDQVEIATLLARLALDAFDGALMLQDGPIKKLVYFQRGSPVGIKSNLVHECLGQMLVREGRIGQADCDRSLDLMRASNRRQGETLVDMGCLSPNLLASTLHHQFLLKYQQVLTWNKGAYRYRDTSIPPAYYTAQREDPADLIWQAILVNKPLLRARALLEPLLSAPVHWSSEGLDLSRLTIGEDLLELWTRIDGTATLGQLIGQAAKPNEGFLLLYTLTALGALTYLA